MPKSRVLSLLIALICVFLISPPVRAGNVVPALLVALGLIWFCEIFGSFKGATFRGGYVDAETPAGCFAALGWIGLFGVLIYLVYIKFYQGAVAP